MKQKEISALSLEVVSQFFDGTPEPLIEHLSENVLWLGPRDGQFLRGKDVLCSSSSSTMLITLVRNTAWVWPTDSTR